MARKNKSIGSIQVPKKIQKNAPLTFGESKPPIRTQGIEEKIEPRQVAEYTPRMMPGRVEGYTIVPILFHTVYTGVLTPEIIEESLAEVDRAITDANSIFRGEPATSAMSEPAISLGYTNPIDNPEHGIDAGIRFVAADRVPKKDLLPFIPAHTGTGYFKPVDGPAHEGGIQIPNYTTSTVTEEEILVLRVSYEEAFLEDEARGTEVTASALTAATTALSAAEEDYYMFIETPGAIFYKYDASLGGDHANNPEKLFAIRDMEAGLMNSSPHATPGDFFETVTGVGTSRFLSPGTNSKIPCIHTFSNTGVYQGGLAGDSASGTLLSDTYYPHIRAYGMKHSELFLGHLIAHEALHAFGFKHSWNSLSMTREFKDMDFSLSEYRTHSNNASTSSYEFDYDFVPPFVYNDAGDSFESISSDEKTFIENIVNNYLPEFVEDSIRIAPTYTGGPLTVTGGVPSYVSNLMSALPTLWGGSYTEVNGQKKFLINPTQALGRSSGNRSLPALGDITDGGVVFYTGTETVEGVDQEYYLIAREDDYRAPQIIGCGDVPMTSSTSQDLGTGYQNTLDLLERCDKYSTAANTALDYTYGGYSDWYIPSKDELVEYVSLTDDFVFSNNSHITSTTQRNSNGYNQVTLVGIHPTSGEITIQYYNAGDSFPRDLRLIRKEVITPITPIDPTLLYKAGDAIGEGGTIISISPNYKTAYVVYPIHFHSVITGKGNSPSLSASGASFSIFYGDNRQGTYAEEQAIALAASAEYDMIYEVLPDLFEEDVNYGFHGSGDGAWTYNPITQVLTPHPRLESPTQGSWYSAHSSSYVIKQALYDLPEYVAPVQEVPLNRKGPRINIYNPVCDWFDSSRFNVGFGFGLGWYDPRYPKYPEDTLVEDMFNETNCPCLYTPQSYNTVSNGGVTEEHTYTVMDSDGTLILSNAFKAIADLSIEDTAKRDIVGSNIRMGDVFTKERWFISLTGDESPYPVLVPNFSVYIGFTKDSVIPYAIKGTRKINNTKIGAIDDDSIIRSLGANLHTISLRYFFIGTTDTSSPLYNPFKKTDNYPYGESISGCFYGACVTSGGNADLSAYYRRSAGGMHDVSTLYGTLDANYVLNIMHYDTPSTIPMHLSVWQAQTVSDFMSSPAGMLVDIINYSNLVGYNSAVPPLEHPSTYVNAQTFMDDAVQFLVDYDVSTYKGGCTDPEALNYDPAATISTNICIEAIPGCMDNSAVNYNGSANIDDGSHCIYYSMEVRPIHVNYICNDLDTPVCNLYDSSKDITLEGTPAEVVSIGGGAVDFLGTLVSGTNSFYWSATALNQLLPYRYSCPEGLYASELDGPENLTGGCVNIENNDLCGYPSVTLANCAILEAGEGTQQLQGYLEDDSYTLSCTEGNVTLGGSRGDSRSPIVPTAVGYFIIGKILLEDVLFTLLGVSYVGGFIKDLDGTLYEYTDSSEINRDNPLYFRNQLKVTLESKVEKEAKNVMKIKASLDKIINFTK